MRLKFHYPPTHEHTMQFINDRPTWALCKPENKARKHLKLCPRSHKFSTSILWFHSLKLNLLVPKTKIYMGVFSFHTATNIIINIRLYTVTCIPQSKLHVFQIYAQSWLERPVARINEVLNWSLESSLNNLQGCYYCIKCYWYWDYIIMCDSI